MSPPPPVTAAVPPPPPPKSKDLAKVGAATGWAIYPLGQEITPARIKSVLLSAQAGETQTYYAFLDHVARDPHIAACLGKAKRRITAGRIDIKPYPASARSRTELDQTLQKALDAAAVVDGALFGGGVKLREAIKAMFDADWRGIAGVEPIYSADGMLLSLTPIPGQNFTFVKGEAHIQTGETGDRQPVAVLVESGQIIVRLCDKDTLNPALRGIAAKLIPYFFIKHRLPYWWGRYTELLATKPRVGKYPQGDEVTHALLDEAQKLMGSSGWCNIPAEASIELLTETSTKAGSELYEAIGAWCDQQASKLILGGTQTMDVAQGAGSQATSTVHQEDEITLAADRAEDICDVLRPLFSRLVGWQLGLDVAVDHTPTLTIDCGKRPTLLEVGEFVSKVVPVGMRVPESWGYDVTGVWTPEEGEACIGMVPSTSDEPAMPGAAPAVDVQQLALNGAQMDALQTIIQAVADGALPAASAVELVMLSIPSVDKARAMALIRPAESFTPAVPATASVPHEAALMDTEGYASHYASGAGQEILAQIEELVDKAEADGWTLQHLYAEMGRLRPVDAPRLTAILTALRLEAIARGYRG